MGKIKTNLVSGMIITLLMLVMSACNSGPKPIQYGSDQCDHCKMMITEQAFASEIVTSKGKALKFDAIECMAAYMIEHSSLNEQSERWVHDFARSEKWIEAKNALFVKSEKIQSPMGMSLLAFSSESEMKNHLEEYPGQPIEWAEIIDMVKQEW